MRHASERPPLAPSRAPPDTTSHVQRPTPSRHCRCRPFRPLSRAEGRGLGAGHARRHLRHRRRARPHDRLGSRRPRPRLSRPPASLRRPDRRHPRRGTPRPRRGRPAGGQARAGGKADRRHPGRGGRPRRPGRRPPPRAAGRPPGTLLGRARRTGGAHRPAALHRGHPYRPLQAARHRRVGDPRPDDPRPGPDPVTGREPDRACRCGRRRGGQRA